VWIWAINGAGGRKKRIQWWGNGWRVWYTFVLAGNNRHSETVPESPTGWLHLGGGLPTAHRCNLETIVVQRKALPVPEGSGRAWLLSGRHRDRLIMTSRMALARTW
jgi:hypothetical protein